LSDQTILDRLKPHTTSVLNLVGTVFLGGIIAFGNFRSNSTHATDEQATQQQQIESQGKQIASLQEELNRQALILSAVSEFKSEMTTRLDKIEVKIDRELQYHRNSQ
jgi:hypothetical protein